MVRNHVKGCVNSGRICKTSSSNVRVTDQIIRNHLHNSREPVQRNLLYMVSSVDTFENVLYYPYYVQNPREDDATAGIDHANDMIVSGIVDGASLTVCIPSTSHENKEV